MREIEKLFDEGIPKVNCVTERDERELSAEKKALTSVEMRLEVSAVDEACVVRSGDCVLFHNYTKS